MNMKAVCGCDYIRDDNWNPATKTEKGWLQWAEREAHRLSKRDNFQWHGVAAWIAPRNAYRISFAGQQEVK